MRRLKITKIKLILKRFVEIIKSKDFKKKLGNIININLLRKRKKT